ncbi:hypothetical protein LSCM1_08252 [Leishmania martiniquensis]|uniref:Uncharacterized protein n=1 Tax=Leishmania martiniquensis TaxID=1580590 RepID=A0A836HKK3_9TRYP|nr:hypothetical protein LSCM1_08252 [Leishmania martiniquensis]
MLPVQYQSRTPGGTTGRPSADERTKRARVDEPSSLSCLTSASSTADDSMPPPQSGRPQPSSSSCRLPRPSSSQPATQRLCALSAGVLFFHVLTSALQEGIFHLPGFTNVLLLSCGETLCTTVLAGLLLVWGWRKQLPERGASEYRGPRGRSTTTALGKGRAEITLHEPSSRPADELGDTDSEPRWTSGGATACSPGVFCEGEHGPPGPQRSLAHGDDGSAFISVADPLPVVVDAVDGADAPLLTPRAARDAPSAGSASWSSTIRDVFHPSTVSIYWYARIAVLLSCSLYLTNRTSFFLSYALQVTFKSSKLLCMIVVHRWWARARDEEVAPDSVNEQGSDDGAPDEDGGAELHAVAAASNTAEHLLRDEAQRRGSCFPFPPSATFSNAVVNVAPPAGRAPASSHSLDDDQRRSWWGPPRCFGSSRRHSWWWWWPHSWHPHSALDVPRRVAKSGWVCASSFAQYCALRSAKSPADERGPDQAAAGLRQLIFHNRGSDGQPSVVKAWRVAGAWLARQLRRRLQDMELMACIIIVAGLICFTYACQPDMRGGADPSGSSKGPAAFSKAVMERPISKGRLGDYASASLVGGRSVAAGVSDSLSRDTGLSQRHASPPLAPSSLSAPSSPFPPLPSIAAAVSGISVPWVLTLIGVAGVLTSNVLDCIIYALEEVHCFHAAAKASGGPHRRAHQHERAAGENGCPLADVRHGTVPLLPRAPPPQQFLPPCGPPSSARMPAAATPPRRRHVVPARSSTERSAATPASSKEVLFMVNGIATLLYVGGLSASWLLGRAPSSLQGLTNPDVMPAVMRAAGGAFGALTAAEAQRLVACEHRSALSRPTASAAIPAECVALMVRQQQLQWYSRSSAGLSSAAPSAPQERTAGVFPTSSFWSLIVLASVTSLMGTLCLLRIVAEFTGVAAVIVTSMRKALTILLSFVLYRRRFTPLHAVGLAGVMGGVVWYELQRRRRYGM